MPSDTVLVKINGNLATVTINRSRALNTLNMEALDALSQAVHELAGHEDVRVIIVTGSGSRAFCAGADIAMMLAIQPVEARELATKGQRILRDLESSSKPVIAAINVSPWGGMRTGHELRHTCGRT